MSEINLFKILNRNKVDEVHSKPVLLEKELQTLIEDNMQIFFGVTFIKSEFSMPNGRIDSLGLDENNCPVIFEYKRHLNENVINQGLFYLDWLLDHKADFRYLVEVVLGKEKSNSIDWTIPCVICIANEFSKYDEHAVNQMQRNIKLVKYKKFNNELILFEHINAPKGKFKSLAITGKNETIITTDEKNQKNQITVEEALTIASEEIQNIFSEISEYILSKGEDVVENILKFYIAYKKVKNIICLEVYKKSIFLDLKLNPKDFEIIEGFTRDMTGIGHYGTGDFRIIINNKEDLEKAKKYIDIAYDSN